MDTTSASWRRITAIRMTESLQAMMERPWTERPDLNTSSIPAWLTRHDGKWDWGNLLADIFPIYHNSTADETVSTDDSNHLKWHMSGSGFSATILCAWTALCPPLRGRRFLNSRDGRASPGVHCCSHLVCRVEAMFDEKGFWVLAFGHREGLDVEFLGTQFFPPSGTLSVLTWTHVIKGFLFLGRPLVSVFPEKLFHNKIVGNRCNYTSLRNSTDEVDEAVHVWFHILALEMQLYYILMGNLKRSSKPKRACDL